MDSYIFSKSYLDKSLESSRIIANLGYYPLALTHSIMGLSNSEIDSLYSILLKLSSASTPDSIS